MTSSEAPKPKKSYSRRFFWLAVFIVILFGGYSAGWYYVADRILQATKVAIAEANRDGVTAECANPAMHGYPFRIGVYCDSVAYDNSGEQVAFAAGNLRTAGQIYDPARIVAELDGPARLDLPEEQQIELSWDALRASVRLAQPLPERLSIEGNAMTVVAGGKSLGKADAFEAHARPSGADLDLASSVDGLAVDPAMAPDRKLPVLSSRSDISIKDGVALLQAGAKSLRGTSGTIRTLELSSGPDTGFGLAGTFSVDADGLVDADLQLTIRDPKGLSVVLADAIPEERNTIEAGFSGLVSLGAQPSLPVFIRKGAARLGFIQLGQIPPVK